MNSALLYQQSNREVHRVADDWFLHFDLRPRARLENVGYWGNRYHMTIDKFGARAPTHPAEKGAGVFRILCFGGSTMYGADVSDEETIPAALERRLNAEESRRGGAAPRRFEAWNFGTHAYMLSQAAHRARSELVVRDPDLILVQLHNVGPRAFFLERAEDQWTTLRRFAMDPHVLPENFPPPNPVPAVIHASALKYSAAYRLLVGYLRRVDRADFPYAEELSRKEARALTREAAARDVPVVFFSIPSDGSGPVAATVYPELPEEQFINFYEDGQEPDYYMMHPPARFLDEYAGQLIEILRQRGYLPSSSGRELSAAPGVASSRTIAVEQRVEEPTRADPPPARSRAAALAIVAVLVALSAMLLWVFQPFWRRWRTSGRPPVAGVVQLIGLTLIAAWLPEVSAEASEVGAGDRATINPLVLIGVLPLIVFLWLVLSGVFGYGSVRREDWPALLPFLVALGIREGYARHGIEELEIYFYYGAVPNRHSVIHPLYQMFVQSLADDPYWFMMHVNGVLGALATLPLFLFVRQRTGSRMTAALVAIFYAVHPVIVQMTPTDGHFALVLSTWFAGLALLTADKIGARQLFGGAVLLGIAATGRAEGSLYLLASLLLLDVRRLLAAARDHIGAAVLSACVVVALVALHVHYCFPAHIPPGQALPQIGTVTPIGVLRASLFSTDFNHPIVVGLVLAGMLAGLVDERFRLGLGAALGTLIVVWPMSMETTQGFTVLHRLVPVCVFQVIAAGVGASWLTSWLPSRVRHHWAAAIPGVALALFLFATHRHEIRAANAVTDEFWMLRNHLAPGGAVQRDCALMFVGSTMDTDIHDFGQVLPGMPMIRCEQEDCLRVASHGGCLYYLRNINCYSSAPVSPPECVERGRTPAGDLFPCLDPRCVQLERSLELSPIEERTVDLYAAFRGSAKWPRWPRKVDIGLYRVMGALEQQD
jgi:hypothetical protein